MPMRDTELSGLAMTLSRAGGIKVTVSGNDSYCTADGTHINIAGVVKKVVAFFTSL